MNKSIIMVADFTIFLSSIVHRSSRLKINQKSWTSAPTHLTWLMFTEHFTHLQQSTLSPQGYTEYLPTEIILCYNTNLNKWKGFRSYTLYSLTTKEFRKTKTMLIPDKSCYCLDIKTISKYLEKKKHASFIIHGSDKNSKGKLQSILNWIKWT